MYIKKNIVTILLIIVLIVQVGGMFFSVPEGMSEEEYLYRIKVHDLNQEKAELLKINNKLEYKIKTFKDEILKNDSIVGSYSNEQLDSAFSDYFSR